MREGGQKVRVSEDQLEQYFWHAAGREGGVWGEGCLFHDVSVWPHISRGRSTNQSRPHPIIHWLPEELTAACRISPLEPSDLLTEARKKTEKPKEKKTTCNKKAALIVADIPGNESE